MRCKVLLLILSGSLAATPSSAVETVYSTAGRQDPLNNVGGTARAIGMGSAFIGVSDDASAIYWNPAGLSTLKEMQLSIHHRGWLVGTFQESMVFGMPMPSFGGFGLSFDYVGYGSSDWRDSDGFPVSGSGTNQFGAGLGWGKQVLGDLSVGLAFHAAQQNLAGNSYFLIAEDAGLLAKTKDGWGFGLSCEHLGQGMLSHLLSSSFRLGLSKQWKDINGLSMLAALSGNIKPDIGESFQAGFEFSFHSTLFLRGGYDFQLQGTGYSGAQQFSVGAGVALSTFRIDYAFVPYGELGNAHLASVGYFFEETPSHAGSSAGSPVLPQTSSQAIPSTAPATAQTGSAPTTASIRMATPVPQGMNQETSMATGQEGLQTQGRTIIEFGNPAEDKMEEAKALAKAGHWNESIRVFKEILVTNPSNVSAWWELGNVYFRLNHKEYAVYCFEQVLKLKSDEKALADWLEKYKSQVPKPAVNP